MSITVIRTALLYGLLILAVRLMGKRQVAEMEPAEFVVTMLLANLAAVPMQENGLPLLSGVAPIFTVLGLELILAVLSMKLLPIRRLLNGVPTLLIRDGKIDQKALAWALQTGEILYAGLDTVEVEPIEPDDPLLKMDNVILNPHSGSYGAGAKKTQIKMVCEVIPNAVVKGELEARCVANRAMLNKELPYKQV